ncbi:MAG: hypothetical protein HYR85_27330 [Planctomycetes bacterium]|nr:hypothetical protein [Planctomycetota bacterium]MBI3848367.1 hypothetical protein [Planctomycetota bacterium]
MSLRSISLLIIALCALGRAAVAQPNLTIQPTDVAPGGVMSVTVVNADPNSQAVLCFALGPGTTVLGPFRSPCGPLSVTVNLQKPVRQISRGRVSPTGVYQVNPVFPVAVPARLNGRTIFAQVFTARPTRVSGNCVWHVETTNLASFTLHFM